MGVTGRDQPDHIAHGGDHDRDQSTGDDQALCPIAKDDRDQFPLSRGDQELNPTAGDDRDRYPLSEDDQDSEGRSCWEKATIAFTFLKQKIASTPILKHFDPDRPPVIVVYASGEAIFKSNGLKGR